MISFSLMPAESQVDGGKGRALQDIKEANESVRGSGEQETSS